MNVLNTRSLTVAALAACTLPVQRATAQEPTGIRAELITDLNQTEQKWVALAEAMSEDQYSWRPMEGVRSVGEVFMHIAAANVLFSQFVGYTPSEDVPEELRNAPLGTDPPVQDKAHVIAALHAAFENARATIRSVSAEDLDQTTEFFGQTVTNRAILLLMCNHAHEHLGQQIAYARSNNVVPPWSQGGQ